MHFEIDYMKFNNQNSKSCLNVLKKSLLQTIFILYSQKTDEETVHMQVNLHSITIQKLHIVVELWMTSLFSIY